jgi:hypothetical protein
MRKNESLGTQIIEEKRSYEDLEDLVSITKDKIKP